ncbi:NAD(P)H-binding protein [Litorivita sp. NS0012-18]|uniref:SDR family oxidoreductase n=1 Tax=Litorivita sp. NS0012-18 TaxID=3127655 RepID=UPI003108AD9C
MRALSRRPDAFDWAAHQPDEVFLGEATDPATLTGLCDGIDYVFSSLGITRQTDKVGYWDVDYGANKSVLDLAVRAGARKFVFISVVRPELTCHVDLVAAREAFADDLAKSGLDYTVARATGFFNDMLDFLKMARGGRVYVFGAGKNRINPIHGADLANRYIDAFTQMEHECSAGGPETLTYDQIDALACEALGKPVKITHVPGWMTGLFLAAIKPFNKKLYTALAFLSTVMQNDITAPATGTHRLGETFHNKAADA